MKPLPGCARRACTALGCFCSTHQQQKGHFLPKGSNKRSRTSLRGRTALWSSNLVLNRFNQWMSAPWHIKRLEPLHPTHENLKIRQWHGDRVAHKFEQNAQKATKIEMDNPKYPIYSDNARAKSRRHAVIAENPKPTKLSTTQNWPISFKTSSKTPQLVMHTASPVWTDKHCQSYTNAAGMKIKKMFQNKNRKLKHLYYAITMHFIFS